MGETDNWELRFVGPVAYMSNKARDTTYTTYDHWSGDVDGNLQNLNNWCKSGSATGNPAASVPGSLWFCGEKNTVVTNTASSMAVKGIRVHSDAAPFIVRGNVIKTNRNGSGWGNSTASIYTASSYPLIFECPIATSASAGPFIIAEDGSAYVAFMGPVQLASSSSTFRMRGAVLVGNTFDAKSLELCGDNAYSIFEVLSTGAVTIANQTDVFSNQTAIVVNENGSLTFTGGEFKYGVKNNTHTIDGLMDIQVPFSGSGEIEFGGSGELKIASVKSSEDGDATVNLNGKISLIPPAKWTTTTVDAPANVIKLALPEWGRATIKPTSNFEYGTTEGGATSSRALACAAFSQLTIDSDNEVIFSDPLVFGEHTKLIKEGAGTMYISERDVMPEFIELNAGKLVFATSKSVGEFSAKSNSTIELAEGAMLNVLDGNVSLSGVKFVVEASDKWRTLLKVAKWREITSLPQIENGLKLKLVANNDETTSLQICKPKGFVLFVR